MRSFSSCTFLVVLGLLAGRALGDDPDPREIIAKADQATRAVRMVSYRAEAWGAGDFKDEIPHVRATVSAKEGPEGSAPLLRFEGTMKTRGSDETRAFQIAVDHKRVISVDQKEKVCTVGELPEAIELFFEPLRLVYLHKFLHPTPFSNELNAESRTYEGRRTVSGTACHVVYVVYGGGRGQARWYFGADDSLPHRVDYVIRAEQRQGVHVLELSDINTAPKFDDTTFATEVPPGYERREYARTLRSDPNLLPPGSRAPDWTLRTPEGKWVSLSGLRGKVVVLDFWATWCVPCIMAMPGVQKLHETFKDRPVAVFGINSGERDPRANPAGFMKKNRFTYGLLLNGEQVAKAYRVIGIPTFYAIDPDGKILYAVAGYDPTSEQALVRLIDDALKSSD